MQGAVDREAMGWVLVYGGVDKGTHLRGDGRVDGLEQRQQLVLVDEAVAVRVYAAEHLLHFRPQPSVRVHKPLRVKKSTQKRERERDT